nr:hypothetical protein [uncultured Dysosmobacter sp.]
MADAKARRAETSLKFNGKSVNTSLKDYLESVEYTDVASGSSDSISITLHNIDMRWLSGWYPKKGDKMSGTIFFRDWNKDGKDLKIECGSFVLDSIKYSGGPLQAIFEGLAIPASESFKTRERTKTWKKVTIKQIGREIAKRYKLKFKYDAGNIKINAIEQSQKADSAFLYDLCQKYGLAMKAFRGQIIIFDKGKYEKKNPVTTIARADFVDDAWDFIDTLEGTYTGARISYKSGKNSKEINTYVGLVKENSKKARTLKVSEQADDLNDAKHIAAAKVNEANEQATTISGTIWANPKVVAGATVNVVGLGKGNGKYYVDQVKTSVSDGTTMDVELHKCQKRLSFAKKAKSSKSAGAKKKTYKVGDIVNFHGGKHYVSSYPGATGYSVKAGKAKITIANGSGKAHPWHLVTQNWSQTSVYGWVDSGTFD